MEPALKNLCIFTHFSKYQYIPLYVKIYIEELSAFFDRVILVTNERPVENPEIISASNVSMVFVENEGYDLGMFYKVFQKLKLEEYSQIACVNDSNILFNRLHPIFEWSKQQTADFWGLIDSHQRPPFSSHANNYHLQSHFLVFNRKAFLRLPDFFESLHLQDIFKEKDTRKLRQTVIDKWEIGLSQFLLNEGLTSASYIDSRYYSDRYKSDPGKNVGLKLYAELIQSGYPLIKMKVITKGKLKDIFRLKSYWKNLIETYGNRNWEIKALLDELEFLKRESGNQPLNKIRRLFL